MKFSIGSIASLITEDPDILTELDSSLDRSLDDPGAANTMPATPDQDASVVEPEIGSDSPMSAIEVEKQATELTGGMADENPDQITDQVKAQEEATRQQEMERQKLVQPQIDALGSSMTNLDTNVAQGLASAQKSTQTFAGLNDEMSQIQALLQQLEKQV
jgi:hypothetical protein